MSGASGLDAAHDLGLLLASLEATVAELGRCVDELQPASEIESHQQQKPTAMRQTQA